MYFNFDTDKLDRAKAALLLYGLYKSREGNSSLNGMETWSRFQAYARAACIKSNTIGGFIQQFCRKAGITSIKPKYFGTDDPVQMPGEDYLVVTDKIKDYRLGILGDDSLLKIINDETMYLIMLIRERIQRENFTGEDSNED